MKERACGWWSVFTSKGPGSTMARRVVLPAIAMALSVEWLRVFAEHSRFMAIRWLADMALFASVVGMVVIVMWNAKALDRADAERMETQASLRLKEKELFQASKLEAIGRLAGGVAHDFNNILTGIIGLTEDVAAELPVNHPQRETLSVVCQAAERAAQLTKQLLGFSRQQIATPVVVDLNDEIRALKPLLGRSLGPDIELVDELCVDPLYVRADATQVEQILLNLSLNARDAMTAGGRLTFRTLSTYRQGKRFACWEVSDSGVGMSAETLKYIFEPFFTTKDIGRGTGLGLATVYGIVQQNGGDIEVQSEPEKGSTFCIFWPCTEQRPESHAVSSEVQSTEKRRETILVVDDEAIVLRFVTKVLSKSGYSILSAANAFEALKVGLDRKTSIDLLLTDVVMPQINGSKLSAELQSVRPGLRVLFMSGFSERVVVERGILKPGIHFIEKAFNAEKLREKVQEVLR